jgi:hypothetical protein
MIRGKELNESMLEPIT